MPATIPVNREKIWGVVSNLIANAVKVQSGEYSSPVRAGKKQLHISLSL
jgi:hypothetical protein